MHGLEWNAKRNAVAVPEIDEQHQAIFELANSLYLVLEGGAMLSAVVHGVRELITQTTRHFAREERIMRSTRQIAQVQMPDTDTDEPLHAKIDCIKHAAELAIHTLPKDNAKVSRCDWVKMLNPCAFAIEDNSLQQFRRDLCIPLSIEEYFVFLVDLVAGMGQVLGKVTVIREKNEPLSLRVEPADIEQARKFCRKQIENCVARVRIVSR